MKITQTDTQIDIKTSGTGQIIIGAFFAVIGVLLAVLILSGTLKNGGQKTSPGVSVVGLIFAVIGGLLVAFAQNRRIVLQKGGTSTVTATRILGGKTQNQSFATDDIGGIRLSTGYESNGSGSTGSGSSNAQRRSTLELIMKNNDVIEIGSSTSSMSGVSVNGLSVGSLMQKAPLSKESQQIAGFLGLPLQAIDMSNPITAVKTVINAFQQAHDEPAGTPAFGTAQPTSAVPPTTPAQPVAAPLSQSAIPAPQPQVQQPPKPPQAPQPPIVQPPQIV